MILDVYNIGNDNLWVKIYSARKICQGGKCLKDNEIAHIVHYGDKTSSCIVSTCTCTCRLWNSLPEHLKKICSIFLLAVTQYTSVFTHLFENVVFKYISRPASKPTCTVYMYMYNCTYIHVHVCTVHTCTCICSWFFGGAPFPLPPCPLTPLPGVPFPANPDLTSLIDYLNVLK